MKKNVNSFSEAFTQLIIENQNQQKVLDEDCVYIKTFFSQEIIHFFANLFHSKEDRKQLLTKNFKQYFSLETLNFLKILIDYEMFAYIHKIFNQVEENLALSLNIIYGQIYSVEKLNANELNKIESELSKKELKKIILKNLIDQDLIGGIKIIVNDKVFDYSIKNKIEKIKSSI